MPYKVDWKFIFFLLSIGRDLSYNKLTGEIPFNIGFLQVATLYVSSIHCASWLLIIYEGVLLLTLLARSLQGNQLGGTIPSVIGLMQALAVL